ncbi:hypothetical protein H311_00816 [Anncaliia algerae PRA109]|nr:hypothetical protein H311_00816 [Anncaliia algerae PRA109]
MKNTIFLFTAISTNLPQVEWSIENFISEDTHIILIFVLTEQYYYISDHNLNLKSLKINVKESEKRRNEVKNFLDKLSKKIKKNINVKVSKVILCGEQKDKVSYVIKKIDATAIVIGPDITNKKSYFIFESMEDYLCKNANTAVIKIDK